MRFFVRVNFGPTPPRLCLFVYFDILKKNVILFCFGKTYYLF